MRPVLRVDPDWWGVRLNYLQLNAAQFQQFGWEPLVQRVEEDGLPTFAGFEVRDRFGNLVARYTKLSRRTNWKEF